MPAFNFKGRFASAVEGGAKRQTIRAKRKHRPRVGQIAYCYYGARGRGCRLLGAWPIAAVLDITIEPLSVRVDGLELIDSDLDDFARDDGFDDIADMLNWFRAAYGLPFHGDLIMWHGSDDPYADGCDAYLAGFPETDNPYAPTTDDHLSWNDGWLDTEKREGGGE